MLKYNINSVIKRLQEAQKNGKELISESELLCIATPQIYDIDNQIRYIERGIEKQKTEYIGYGSTKDYVTFSKAEDLTGIPRQTFNRWEKDGTIIRYKNFNRKVFNLKELKKTLLLIQERQ